MSSHGDARLHSAAVRSGAGSSQRHCRATAGITPSEIAPYPAGHQKLLDDGETEGVTQESDGVAIDYALSNWVALLRYTEDGDLEIDNNRAERSLRYIVVGRRNWLFYGSDKGGRTGAVLSTLIASCKRLRIEPFAYLRDLFTRISTHPQHRLDELLPDKWLLAQQNVSSAHEET